MNRFDSQRRRLVGLLGGVFAVLVCASAVLVLQSLSRLEAEAFHAQRAAAEELVGRIDRTVADIVAAEQARPPTDYDFLVVSGERYVQRSPLSSLTPDTRLPGVVGYFQVDARGRFSTPLLPAHVDDPEALELTEAEFEQRRVFERRLRRLLEQESAGGTRVVTDTASRDASPAPEGLAEDSPQDPAPAATPLPVVPAATERALARAGGASDDGGGNADAGRAIYQKLIQADSRSRTTAPTSVDELADQQQAEPPRRDADVSAPSAPAEAPTESRQEVRQVEVVASDEEAPLTSRISAFQSAVDPFHLTVLDDRHLVLYRKVWLEGQHVQGAVIEQERFLDMLVGGAFTGTSLARHGDLTVAVGGGPVRRFPATGAGTAETQSRLLLETRLARPADAVQLTFRVTGVPLGPGAVTLGWSAAVMALVLCGGFVALWYLGRYHIRMAEQQQDFVSAVSHELKTPLTSIRMYGEILKAGWADEDKKRSYYDFILSESERLSRLIGNVLHLARITRNDAPSGAISRVPLETLLDQTRSKVESAVAAAGLTLEQAHDDDALAATVEVDEDAFMQVMINLVDNAIKFSAQAQRRSIELGTRRDRDRVEVRVRDFGPGVPRDQMKKIFRLFYRPESELTRETAGTGIGLALVRELAGRMGGSVDVVNRHPGAEFRVYLKVAAA